MGSSYIFTSSLLASLHRRLLVYLWQLCPLAYLGILAEDLCHEVLCFLYWSRLVRFLKGRRRRTRRRGWDGLAFVSIGVIGPGHRIGKGPL